MSYNKHNQFAPCGRGALCINMNKEATNLIDLAIEAGRLGSQEIYDHFTILDETLGTDHVSNNVRNFFDSWSDAIGHDYLPYNEKNLNEWVGSAEEIRQHYLQGNPLSHRKIWQECAVKNA